MEEFLQKLLRKTDAALHEVLDGWNWVTVKQKQIRTAIEIAKIRKDGVDGVAAADGAADGATAPTSLDKTREAEARISESPVAR